MVKIAHSVLEIIGNTPMVRLNRLVEDGGAEVCVKLEYHNPSGSIKDRMALYMVEEAERKGLLHPGDTIIEASTGNTAAALSLVAAVKGYKMLVFTPEAVASPERLRLSQSLGAEIRPVDTKSVERQYLGEGEGAHGGILEIIPRSLCKQMEETDPKVWWARQFKNPDNVAAHRETTGREILEQTDGQVDAFVASIGTAGTLLGVGQALKEANWAVRLVAVEPTGASMLLKGREGLPIIPGVTDGLVLDLLDSGLVDEVITVDEQQAIEMTHRLAEQEGLLAGISSGANVVAALQVARKLGVGKRVVTVLVDRRERYFTVEKYIT